MTQSEQLSKQNKIVEKYLQQLGEFKDLPPNLHQGDDFPKRLLNIQDQKEQFLLTIDSTDLELADRVFLEKYLLKAADQQKEKWMIYFKSSTTQSTTTTNNLASSKRIDGIKKIVLVASGKGGVGKTTMAASIAKSLRSDGESVGLLDADIQGPSLGHMMEIKTPATVSGKSLIPALTSDGIKTVSFTYLTEKGQPIIWRGPMLNKAIGQLLFEVEWGKLDTLIVDLPPGTGDTQMSLLESVQIDGAYIIITPHQLAIEDASRAVAMFKQYSIPILAVIENMSYFMCGDCDTKHRIFGETKAQSFAESHQIKKSAQVPFKGQGFHRFEGAFLQQ